MVPSLSASASSSASSKGGEFFGGAAGFNQGDWIVSTGTGSAGVSTKTILLIAAGAGVLWFLTHRKK